MKKWMVFLLALAAALPVYRTAQAQDPSRVSSGGNMSASDRSRVSKIASDFGVSEDEVRSLRDRELKWSEVRHALFISQRSGTPASEIVDQHDAGLSWNEIANKYNLNLRDEGRMKAGTMNTPSGTTPGQTTTPPAENTNPYPSK